MRRTTCAVLSALAFATAATGAHYAGSFGEAPSSSTKYLGQIIDTYGCIYAGTRYSESAGDQVMLATVGMEVGAVWGGSQYEVATEPQNSPPKKSIERHIYQLQAPIDPDYYYAFTLGVGSNCEDKAAGQANWLVANEEWWFNPVVNVTQMQPRVYESSDGQQWTQAGFTDMQDDTLGWAAVSPAGSGLGVRMAVSDGNSSQDEGTKWWGYVNMELRDAPAHCQVVFEFLTTTSADCDNCLAAGFAVFLDCHLESMLLVD
jgi:hypothetical protein